jgi:endo-1,4-beta-xylanase
MFRGFSRRSIFAAIVIVLLLILAGGAFYYFKAPSSSAATSTISASITLGAAAAARNRVFGAAVTHDQLSDPQFTSVLSSQFTGLTPGNEMKWETTEPTRNTFNFGPADDIVNYALSHHMKVRGHTLVWYSQLAPWVSQITSGSDLLQAMKNHITTEVTHFKGKVVSWDVVNEAFDDSAGLRLSPFRDLIGPSYIETAFRTARAADPNALLCYNAMVKDFKARGVPIDCVGFQSHLTVGGVPSDMQANLKRFADLGVTVQVTELDVRMTTPPSSSDLQQQASDYKSVVSACLAVARCNDITIWGIHDADSWIPQFFPGYGAALPFDDNYHKKQAYTAMIEVLTGRS